jgi:hypothetical protein
MRNNNNNTDISNKFKHFLKCLNFLKLKKEKKEKNIIANSWLKPLNQEELNIILNKFN